MKTLMFYVFTFVEVLMDGDFSIEVAAVVTERVIAACYKALSDHHVLLEGTLLKPNMVRSGSDAVPQASAKEIALATVRVLQVRVIDPYLLNRCLI
jgi:fructose-bisphosphate aldolase class I